MAVELEGGVSSDGSLQATNAGVVSTAEVNQLTLQKLTTSGSEMLARWKCPLSRLDYCLFKWEYYNTTQKVWVLGGTSNVKNEDISGWFQATFNAPTGVNASKVRCAVTPVSEKRSNNQGYWWVGSQVTSGSLAVSSEPVDKPSTPPTPSFEVVNNATYKVTFRYQDTKATHIEVQTKTKNDDKSTWTKATTLTKRTNGEYDTRVTPTAGTTRQVRLVAYYKVGSKMVKSDASGVLELVGQPAVMHTLKAAASSTGATDSGGSVKLSWVEDVIKKKTRGGSALGTVVVEYATYNAWSVGSNDYQTEEFPSAHMNGANASVLITGLERGKTWYFRMRRKNANDMWSKWATTTAAGTATVVSAKVSAPAVVTYALTRPNISNVEDTTVATDEQGRVRITWTGGPWGAGYSCEVQRTELADNYSSSAVDSISSTTLDYEDSYGNRKVTISGLERGKTWYFRIRIRQGQLLSNWATVSAGKFNHYGSTSGTIARATLTPAPAITGPEDLGAPTCVTTPTACTVGDVVLLAWTHNSGQDSDQSAYQLEVKRQSYGTSTWTTQTLNGTADSSYAYDTTGRTDGTTLRWRVRTKGVDPAVWSPWSRQQDVRVWDDGVSSVSISPRTGDAITRFPVTVSVTASGLSQANRPIAWWAQMESVDSYTGIGTDGQPVTVQSGAVMWRHDVDANDAGFSAGSLAVDVGASDVALANGRRYRLRAGCVTAQGLRNEAVPFEFETSWSGDVPIPSSYFVMDEDDHCCYVYPSCFDEEGELADGVTLSVWRIERDGSTVLIQDGIDNGTESYVTDPHPTHGLQWYRTVAHDVDTGAQNLLDQYVRVSIPYLLIQWNERWEQEDEDDVPDGEEPRLRYAGMALELPYNLKIDEGHSPDVALREYLGRSHPVSAYGTQRGRTSSISCDIRRDDEATLSLVRMLAAWRGDCYVREPTGDGYWASIGDVRVTHSYDSRAVGVSMTVTRVEPPADGEVEDVT